ncbi:hypothetical protein L1887_38689 [Cichorium endivia]|nr:hypothetical protein L1887_38689 [Cichorium endivia]
MVVEEKKKIKKETKMRTLAHNPALSSLLISLPVSHTLLLKIRRLDAELPPIIEEEEMVNPVLPSQPTSVEQVMTSTPVSLPENEERALVLYEPMNNNNIPSLQSRSPFSLSVNSDFLSRYKSKYFTPYILESVDGKPEEHDGDSVSKTGSLAVVPWVAPPSHHRGHSEVEVVPEASEMMDSDDMEAMTMDIEYDNNSQQIHRNEMNQWQQHCLIPEAPVNLSTPISWSGI